MDVNYERQLAEQIEAKALAVQGMRNALAQIEQQGREPDPWERVHLATALGLMFHGMYDGAVGQAELAVVPPERRSTTARPSTGGIYSRCTLAFLQKGLAQVEAEPVHPYVIFRRIE